MKVAVDIMGGDHAPDEIIGGCVKALSERSGFGVVMFGDKARIEKKLTEYAVKADRIEIVGTTEIITNDDVPTAAVKGKKDSSLVRAALRAKEDDDCAGLVSAGSTGAVLTAATLLIGRIRGVVRPALAPLLPTLGGGNVILVDCGANVDCKANMLVGFAKMGKAYAEALLNVDSPKIGLLSNGTEDKKGNELTHETFGLLKEDKDLNFLGNMEARDILSGNYDVVVADGFNGNIALKSAEGTALMLMKLIKEKINSSFSSKLGGALIRKKMYEIKSVMDFNEKGGAPFLGVKKPVIKSHGASRANSICGSIYQVIDMYEAGFTDKLAEALHCDD